MAARRSIDPRARDAALRRLRRLTAAATAGATALTGVFAGLAASSLPGRKVTTHTVSRSAAPRSTQAHRRAHRTRTRRRRTEAHVVAPAPAPPPATPAPTVAQPVVVSGGS